ncbi:MAG TPA: hypothetical protein PLR65_00185 [Anaerolineales bacterium]|nr:hypothetical protein [Anaerolineales bacterium]
MLVKLFILLVFAGGILLGFRRESNLSRVFLNLVALYAGAWILFMAYLWVNHVNFPLNLEAMELPVSRYTSSRRRALCRWHMPRFITISRFRLRGYSERTCSP